MLLALAALAGCGGDQFGDSALPGAGGGGAGGLGGGGQGGSTAGTGGAPAGAGGVAGSAGAAGQAAGAAGAAGVEGTAGGTGGAAGVGQGGQGASAGDAGAGGAQGGQSAGGSSGQGGAGTGGAGPGGAGQGGQSGAGQAGAAGAGQGGAGAGGGGCPDNFADCDGDLSNGCEVDTQGDAQNCGACGQGCVLDHATAACGAGLCKVSACDTDYADCDGDPANGCEVFLQGDASHCGACSNACPTPSGANAVCIGGKCGASNCSAPLENCDMSLDGSCEVDLSTDAQNCSACGQACSFANAASACDNSACVLAACNMNYQDCNKDPVDGCESNSHVDASNCGSCGKACSFPNGVPACAGGSCVLQGCAAGYKDANANAGDGCELKCPVFPTSAEICNGLDDDCDGVIDNGLTLRAFYPDADGDGFADASGMPVQACAAPAGYAPVNGDCDDASAARSPAVPEVCGDNLDNNCNGIVDDPQLCCPDKDGDGYLSPKCGGADCDDNDPKANVAEICGDGLDNDCNGVPDDNCAAGAYVSSTNGSDTTGIGTKLLPFKSIGKAIMGLGSIGAKKTIYVAEGAYPENVTAVDGLTLLGGYQCSSDPCQWVRDPAKYYSKVTGSVNALNVLTIPQSVTRSTLIDGLWFVGAAVTNAAIVTPADAGVTAVKMLGTPVLSNNVIQGGSITGSAAGHRAIGLWVANGTPSASPPTEASLVVGNVIVGGKAATTAAGLGVLVSTVLAQNLAPPYTEMRSNTIVGGTGRSGSGMVVWASKLGSLLIGNSLFAGSSNGADGWALDLGSSMIVDRNRLNVGAPSTPFPLGNGSASCVNGPSQEDFFCGGLKTNSATATITNNIINGFDAPRSAAVKLQEVEQAIGAIILNGNYLNGQGSSSGSAVCAALTMNHVNCGGCGVNAIFGDVRNNILDGGVCASPFGVYEAKSNNFPTKTAHPHAFTHNDVFFSKGGGTGYRFWDGASGTPVVDPLQAGALPFPAQTVIGSLLAADPKIDGTFHLNGGSPCIDAGTATQAPSFDIDGDVRPDNNAFDIGPDEAN
jgi:hypothetical protein